MTKIAARDLIIGRTIQHDFSQFWHMLSLYLSYISLELFWNTQENWKQIGEVDFIIIKLSNIRFIVGWGISVWVTAYSESFNCFTCFES
jgi:hypothetical protein